MSMVMAIAMVMTMMMMIMVMMISTWLRKILAPMDPGATCVGHQRRSYYTTETPSELLLHEIHNRLRV
eukprot:3483109-Karenia_brevis.AAC.1